MDGLGQTRALDERIAGLAEGQHGVVARRQLLAMGAGEEAKARWMAAVLFAGPGAVLSHRSSAELWRMRNPSNRAIEVSTPAKSRSRGSIHRHFATLPADEVTVERGIPATTVPRTLLDRWSSYPSCGATACRGRGSTPGWR
jgi:predicted transcriptional regulator of viral defense system